MVGRQMSDFYARHDHHAGEVILRVRDLGRTGKFAGVSFDLRRGEVLGLAGLVGAGRTDIALALYRDPDLVRFMLSCINNYLCRLIKTHRHTIQ